MLAVNDPWAREVENTSGQDRIVTADKMDEGQESTEKVDRRVTGGRAWPAPEDGPFAGGVVRAARGKAHLVLREAAATGSQLRRAPLGQHTIGRPASRSPSVGPQSVGGPRASVSSRSTARTCSPTFSVVRGPLEGLVGCKVVVFLEVDVAKSTANEMKYRATELHREDYEEILAKTRAEEAAEAALRAAGEAKRQAEVTQDAMEKATSVQLPAQWNRPPGLLATKMVDVGVQTSLDSDLSIEASRPMQQVVVAKNVEDNVDKMMRPLSGLPCPLRRAPGRGIRRSRGLFGGCQRCLTRRPSRRESKGRSRSGRRVWPRGREDEKGGEGAEQRARE